MNSKRSYLKLLMASAVVGLFVTNCTIKSATDDGTGVTQTGSCSPGAVASGCHCASTGSEVGTQTCLATSTWDICACAAISNGGSGGSTTTTTGGSTSTGGTTSSGGASGGYSGGGGSAGGSTAGTGGASMCTTGISTTDDCVDCLNKACATQWAACAAEDEGHKDQITGDYCLKNNPQADDGQMDSILNCIAMEQGKPGTTVVKRDVVRACGTSIGTDSDPTTQFFWPPPTMTAATRNLMNCLASPPGAAMPDAWADSNDPASFAQDPDGGLPTPLPWADCTCAKTSCTSPL